MTFRIHLHRDSEAFIRQMLDARRYEHASDVVLEALRLLEDQEKLRDLKRAELFAKIQEGVDAADRGELIDTTRTRHEAPLHASLSGRSSRNHATLPRDERPRGAVVRSIKSRCGRLTKFPYSGQIIDREQHGDKRRPIAGPYIIVSAFESKRLKSCACCTARDIDALLGQDSDGGADDS